MTPADLAFVPATLEQALRIRADGSLDAREDARPSPRPLAGGTDLMVARRPGRAGVPVSLDAPPLFIGRLPELTSIGIAHSPLRIGAAVSLSRLAHEIHDEALHEILRWFASPAIRNVATIGGNVCNASPAADLVPWLLARDAWVQLESVRGGRELPVAEFVTGPGHTVLAPDELLTAIALPRRRGFWYYRKVAPRRSNALSKLSVYAEAEADPDGSLGRVAVSIGAVAPVVIRSREAEALLTGSRPSDLRPSGVQPPNGIGGLDASAHVPDSSPLVHEVLARYESLIRPISDQRSTADYRARTAIRLLADLFGRLIPNYLENP